MAFGFVSRRAAGLPVHHIEALWPALEPRVNPAADQPVADERLERHLDRLRPAISPLAPLELRPQLGEVAVARRTRRVVVGAEQVAVVDEQLLAVPLLQPLVEGGAPAGLPGR